MGLERGRRRLRARREQRGADHPGDEGGGRRRAGQDHLRRDQGARLHDRRELPGLLSAMAAGERSGDGGAGTAAARHRARRHLQDLRAGAGQPRHPPRGPQGHDPRHRRRERRRQVDADVDPLRLLPGRLPARSGSTAGRRRSPTARRRSRAGIGMVHQHFMLVEPFTVLENVVLGAESGRLAAAVARQGAGGAEAARGGLRARGRSRTRWSASSRSGCSSGSRSSRRSTASATS